MTLQGLDRRQAQAIWQPFLGAVAASSVSRFRVDAADPGHPDPAHLGSRLAEGA